MGQGIPHRIALFYIIRIIPKSFPFVTLGPLALLLENLTPRRGQLWSALQLPAPTIILYYIIRRRLIK